LLRNLLQNFRLAWKFPRWRWAILTAVLSDALGFTVVLFPPMEWLLDGAPRSHNDGSRPIGSPHVGSGWA
jgi:hypothetical protein